MRYGFGPIFFFRGVFTAAHQAEVRSAVPVGSNEPLVFKMGDLIFQSTLPFLEYLEFLKGLIRRKDPVFIAQGTTRSDDDVFLALGTVDKSGEGLIGLVEHFHIFGCISAQAVPEDLVGPQRGILYTVESGLVVIGPDKIP